jgi:hypothetical protein
MCALISTFTYILYPQHIGGRDADILRYDFPRFPEPLICMNNNSLN